MEDRNRSNEENPLAKVSPDEKSLSLLAGDDEATTRLNEWLNGGSHGSAVVAEVNSADASKNPFANPLFFTAPLSASHPANPGGNSSKKGILKQGAGKKRENVIGKSDAAARPILTTIEGDERSPGAISSEERMPDEAKTGVVKTILETIDEDSKQVKRKLEEAKAGAVKTFLGTIGGDSQSPGATSSKGKMPEKGTTGSPKAEGSEEEDFGTARPTNYQRTVSWGEQNLVIEGSDAKPKLSPKLSPVHPGHTNSLSIDSDFSFLTQTDYAGSPRSSFSAPKNAEGSSARNVRLDDLLNVNPLESEAETLILKAIEKQEAIANRARTNTVGSAAMLNNVPADSAKVFMPEKKEKEQHGVDEHDTQSAMNRARLHSVDSHTSPVAGKVTAAAGRPGTAPLQRPPLHSHKRNVTMAETLTSLTEALAAYHEPDLQYAGSTSTSSQGNDDTAADASAGEKLAKNANLIYRGRQKTEVRHDQLSDGVSSESVDTGTVSPNWSKLRNSIKTSNLSDQNAAAAMPLSDQGCPGLQVTAPTGIYKKTDGANEGTINIQEDLENGYLSHADERNTGGDSGVGAVSGNPMAKGPTYGYRIIEAPKRFARDFQIFMGQRRRAFFIYIRFLLVVIIPASAAAVILFYVKG